MASKIYHNNLIKYYKEPFGAIEENSDITLRLKVDLFNVKKVFVRLWTDHEEVKELVKKDDIYEIKSKVYQTLPLWYYFIIQTDDDIFSYGCKNNGSGVGCITDKPYENSWQVTVYKQGLKTPDWFKNSIVYQIFPDRFNDNKDNISEVSSLNNYYGGTLKGITAKLGYLKDLGVDTIYLNPIFEASSYHRYDTIDYLRIDNKLGSKEDYIELITRAHNTGIKIILDGVFNHISNKHPIFEDAVDSVDSKNIDNFIFYSYPNKYACWWGFETLPTLNKYNLKVQDFMFNRVIPNWNDAIDGWRLDAVDEIEDFFLKGIHDAIKKESDNVIIGEVWQDITNIIENGRYKNYLDCIDSVMNYPLRDALISFISYGKAHEKGLGYNHIDSKGLRDRLMCLYNNYPKEVFYSLMNLLSSHDVMRLMTLFSFDSKENAIKRYKMAYAFLIYFVGVPSIYYGDEIGMLGGKDPENRHPMKWGDMQDNELLSFFKEIIKIRKGSELLTKGDLNIIYYHEDVFGFKRCYNGVEVIFLMNRSLDTKKIKLSNYGEMNIEGLSYKVV